MKIPMEAELLRIFIGETDRHDGKPLYEVIVEKARSMGIAGATVLKGVMGFGASSRIHTSKVLRLSEDMPMIIEIVDSPEKLDTLMEELDTIVTEGLITRERAQVIAYRYKQ